MKGTVSSGLCLVIRGHGCIENDAGAGLTNPLSNQSLKPSRGSMNVHDIFKQKLFQWFPHPVWIKKSMLINQCSVNQLSFELFVIVTTFDHHLFFSSLFSSLRMCFPFQFQNNHHHY